MKRISLALIFLLLCSSFWGQNWKLGTSCGIAGGTNPTSLAEIKDAGIDYIEISMNGFWRNKPADEVYIRAYKALQNIEASGLKVWSVHLPFSGSLDISVLDTKKREANLRIFEEMIRLAGVFKPKCLVLHPGSDTIKDEKTRTERLKCSRNSIGRLALAAAEIGALLCVEDLPRTCPGRTIDEMDYLTAGIPNVRVCFDTNHLLLDTHEEFLDKLGDRIATIHVSDYDRVDEKHWMPFHEAGTIDWHAFYQGLKKIGYKGVFMFEVKKGEGTPEDLVKVYKQMKKRK